MGDKGLWSLPIDSLRQLQHVVVLKDTATVGQVLKVLASHKLVSAPVVHCEDDSDPHCTWPMDKPPESYKGFVDLKQIIRCFLADIPEESILGTHSMLKRMHSLEISGENFANKAISKLDPTGQGNGCFVDVSNQALSILELVQDVLLSTRKRATVLEECLEQVHRAAALDSQGCISNIISQSDILRFLTNSEGDLGDVKNKDILSLNLGFKPVVSVTPETNAMEALRVLDANRVGAVAVVAKSGRLVGNFSAADMRTITTGHFGALALPVGEFLALEHGTEYSGYSIAHEAPVDGVDVSSGAAFARDRQSRSKPGCKQPPGADVGQYLVVCCPSNTVSEVMGLLVQYQVHRVFIVDDEVVPIGIITVTDVIKKLLELIA